AGAGAALFSVLIGAVTRLLPPQHRGTAAGIINAGGSFGQFIFAPLLQTLIVVLGWMGAMWSIAVIALAALPLARVLRGSQVCVRTTTTTLGDGGLRATLKRPLADRSYLLLHAGFFTCGFHIAFLVTHLPGEVDLCGLPASVASWSLAIIGLANIVGSLAAGWSVNHYRSKYVLFWMYGSRALLVLLYLLAPKSVCTSYLFAAGLGFTWLATVPPTAGVVGKLFGTRYLATLFGLTLLSKLGVFSAPGSGGLRSPITAITCGCGMRMLCWLPQPPYAIYPFANRGLCATQCSPDWPPAPESQSEPKWKFDADMMIRRWLIFALLVFNAATGSHGRRPVRARSSGRRNGVGRNIAR